MTEKILIPLDGSPFGEGALKYVEQLIGNLEPASLPVITLLHVVPVPVRPAPVEGGVFNMSYDSPDREADKAAAVAYLEQAAESLRRTGATVNCLTLIGEAGVSSAAGIIRAEAETGADLVAMSTHGRRGITRLAFGSVTEKVLHGGNVPVRADKN